MKFVTIISITITVGTLLFTGFREVKNQKDIEELRNQVARAQVAEKKYDQPDGATTTANWSIVSDQEHNFSLRYPSSWTTNDSEFSPVVPNRLLGSIQKDSPLTFMTSSNLEISQAWKIISLESGERAYYNFDQGFDFYYIVNGANMLVWSIPARSHDDHLTSQEITEATQIMNTYQKLPST